MRLSVTILFVLVLLLIVLPVGATYDGYLAGYSKEQLLLLTARHLQNIAAPTVLEYNLQQYRTLGNCAETRRANHQAIVEITEILEDGSKNVRIGFLPDEEDQFTSVVSSTYSNPLVTAFLQWDIEEMAKADSATPDYFRHLIRQTLINQAYSEEINVLYEGQRLRASKIIFNPFTDKKNEQIAESYRNKRYEFVVAASVPGGIYSIKTLLPNDHVKFQSDECVVVTFRQSTPLTAFMRKNR